MNNGGPVFPSEQHINTDGHWNQTYDSGMTLRQWYAGKAMASFIIANYELPYNKVATWSYQQADAMIAELEKSNQTAIRD